MSATSKTGRAALVAANDRARRPAEPPQGDLSHAEAQRGGERRDCCQCENVANTQSQYPIGIGNNGTGNTSTMATFSSLPKGWEVMKLYGCFTESTAKNSSLSFTRAMQFNYGRIVDKNESFETDEVKDIYAKYSLVKKGDIVINGLNLNYDVVSQRVAIVPKDGIITSAYIVLRPREGIYPEFFCYLFKALDSRKIFHGMGTGIRLTLSFKELKNMPIPLPPLSEQKAIVAYLDAETGRIDKAIAAEEKMIALLRERREIVINEAVAPRKGWRAKRAKYIFTEVIRPVRPEDDVVTCFRDGQVTLRTNRRTEGFTNSLKEIGYHGVRKGDLVIHNMDAFAGSVGISDSDGKMSPVCTICIPCSEDVLSRFYAFYLRYLARIGFIKSLAKGIRERSTDFRWSDFKELYLPIFPLPEQEAIVERLDRETGKIDRAIEVKRRQIELLRERRQIVIDEVVTGKVKVA